MNEPSQSQDDPVQSLLQRAGRRPEAPAEDAEIVRAAALDQWRRTVRKHRRRRWAYGGAGLLAAALVLAVGLAWINDRGREAPFSGPVGVLEVARGGFSAETGRQQLPTPRVGDPIAAGTVLATGSESRLALRLASGPSVRLDVETRVRCVDPSTLDVEQGAVYVDTGPEPEAVRVQTPFGTVHDVGTRFEVRVDDRRSGLRVRVRDGEIVLRQDETEHRAGIGEALTAAEDGTVSLAEIPTHGESWAWTAEILPAFPTEGATLHDLLAFVAYEAGLELRFAGSASAERARGVAVTGSVDGLGVGQATSVAILGSGLSWRSRVADGILWIEG